MDAYDGKMCEGRDQLALDKYVCYAVRWKVFTNHRQLVRRRTALGIAA